MGTSVTPELGLIKPDLLEPMPNFATQNASNMDTLDQFYSTSLTSYSVAWTSNGSPQPDIGNGTIEGEFMTLWDKLVYFKVRWLAGSTTTFGTSFWFFSLPVAANAIYPGLGDTVVGELAPIGKAVLRDLIPSSVPLGNTGIQTANRVWVSTGKGPSQRVIDDTVPHTWADGDRLSLYGIYVSA